MKPQKEILTSKETADYLGISDNGLAKLRMDGRSPAFFKVGRAVRYRWSAIQQWIDENSMTSTSDNDA